MRRYLLGLTLIAFALSWVRGYAADRYYKIRLAASEFSIRERIKRGPCQLLFFAPHDDESACVHAAEVIIGKFGGRLLELKSTAPQGGESRYLRFRFRNHDIGIDPNRIFTEHGIIEGLKHKDARNLGSAISDTAFRVELVKEISRFRSELLAILKLNEHDLVVALHNNRPGETIWMERYKRVYSVVNHNIKLSTDDLFITTSAELFHILKANQYNVVLEEPGKVEDDGSLSVYCGLQRPLIPYVNVEAQHRPGRGADGAHIIQQTRMLEAVVTHYLNRSRRVWPKRSIPSPIR